MKRLLGLLVVAMLTPAVTADSLSVRVFRVFDGDSFLARMRNQTLRVRLAGVDAPEPAQPHGLESRAILEKMVLGKHVIVEPSGDEVEGHLQARVRWGEYDIGAELVRAGAAWAVPAADGAVDGLAAIERDAREQRRGLWADAVPEAPWRWRERQAAGLR